MRLAAARPVAGVVLEAPLTSTVDVARRTYFWLPISLLITDKYDNERNIRSVTAPVLILHGEQDGVIPVEMGRRASAPRTSRNGSKCSHKAPMTICLATAPGRRRGPLWIRWGADKKRKDPDGPRTLV